MSGLDSKFTARYRCPVTAIYVSERVHIYNSGVCSICGHDNKITVSHCKKEVGKWYRFSLWDRVYHQKTNKWVTKEQLDNPKFNLEQYVWDEPNFTWTL